MAAFGLAKVASWDKRSMAKPADTSGTPCGLSLLERAEVWKVMVTIDVSLMQVDDFPISVWHFRICTRCSKLGEKTQPILVLGPTMFLL